MPNSDPKSARREQALALLRRFYGYTAFRPMQAEVIEHVMDGHDCVVLMPTGGGKSLCYQLPALMNEGCTIVVSPLIALMNDQVAALIANGIPAAAIHSNISDAENRATIDAVFRGQVKLLYISPERLLMEMERWSANMPISLIAIDEAHCISRWGHDFRPSYTQLSVLKQRYPQLPIMALTATADPLTRSDIAKQLGLSDYRLFITSFDRPNLSLRVLSELTLKQRLRVVADTIERHRMDSGILYCTTRKETERMHEALTTMGYRSAMYHAGMDATARDEAQRRWVDGDAQVVCATIAFGMGIDKSNIRWVIHNNLPQNIESFYQEIGRAGRDGAPAETILMYNLRDLVTLRHFVDESGQPELNNEKLQRIVEYATAQVCRRRILLSYFGETATSDCGNCDVCRQPPKRFDGLQAVQKVISAIIRMEEKETVNTVIDVLRASANAYVMSKGYNKLKTYGVGRDLSFGEWKAYITQMLQLGLISIAYDKGNTLSVTPYGREILRSTQPYPLACYVPPLEKRRRGKSVPVQEPVKLSPRESMLIKLKELRKAIAQKEGVAPYMVFTDKSLEAMIDRSPATIAEMQSVEGVGQHKLARYGFKFLATMLKEQGLEPSPDDANAPKRTTALVCCGINPVDLAHHLGIKDSTVYGYITKEVRSGAFTDYRRVMDRKSFGHLMAMREKAPDNSTFYQEAKNLYPDGFAQLAVAIAEKLGIIKRADND